MKLVDILARELKVWPDKAFHITQDSDGRLNGSEEEYPPVLKSACWGGGAFYLDDPVNAFECFVLPVADDWSTSIATRAQWKAAVDALKASESAIPAPSDEAIEAWLVGLEIPYGLEAAQACREIINNHKRKRDEAVDIQKIRDEIKWQKPQLGPCPVEQMYLLGYRKFEIVDN